MCLWVTGEDQECDRWCRHQDFIYSHVFVPCAIQHLCISTGTGAGTKQTVRIRQTNGQLLTAYAFCICISFPSLPSFPSFLPSKSMPNPIPSPSNVCAHFCRVPYVPGHRVIKLFFYSLSRHTYIHSPSQTYSISFPGTQSSALLAHSQWPRHVRCIQCSTHPNSSLFDNLILSKHTHPLTHTLAPVLISTVLVSLINPSINQSLTLLIH